MSNPLVLSLITKGCPDHPRFLISDQLHRYWTGDEWSPDEQAGLLFQNENEAGRVCFQILGSHFKDKPSFHFTAPVQIEVRGKNPPDLMELKLWLIRAARLYVDYRKEGLGDGTVILKIRWGELEVGE